MSISTKSPASEEETLLVLKEQAAQAMLTEPLLAPLLRYIVIESISVGESVVRLLANKLATSDVTTERLLEQLYPRLTNHIEEQIIRDLYAYLSRDSACQAILNPLLFYKGFHALQLYRFMHALWLANRSLLAQWFQSRSSELFGVDIHPAARIGSGIMIDHATALVIGETTIIEDDVSIMQNVTLGGTGKESGDRHPIIRRGSLISAGVTVLGRIEIGECAKIGAGSVVLSSVPAHKTAVGVPAKVVGTPTSQTPSYDMHHEITDDIVK